MTANELIETHIPLANKIAYSKIKSLPRCVNFDEIQSAAFLGLTKAANRYNPSMGEFPAYASCRIVGEIKDYLRSLYWGGREQSIKMSSWDDIYDCATASESEDFSEFFDDIVKNLPPLGKRILRMYYAENCTMKQIAKQVTLSPTRVFQLLKSNLGFLREEAA